jgi:integrase
MASLICDPGGRKRISFFLNKTGKRWTVRLGKMDARSAEMVRTKIEALVVCKVSTQPITLELAQWIADLPPVLHERLARTGLIEKRSKEAPPDILRLEAFIDAYIASRKTVKNGTLLNWRHARHDLIAHFGADRPIDTITQGDADEWGEYMHKTFAPATAGRRAGFAKQFFRWGFRKEMIRRNPFEDIDAACPENKDRTVFITRDMADKVLAACPNAQWRAIFALARFGGLRCPSEVLSLRWGDIDWKQNKMLVRSCKTEHHAGKDKRFVPLFPELRKYLLDLFTEAAPGSEYVITKCRDAGVNLRTYMEKIILRAGLMPWPKLFVNLRSTRQTELVERWPVHVVCAWLGNSALIANRHYLQVTPEHFEQAAMGEEKAAQNQAQSAAHGTANSAQGRNEVHEISHENADSSENAVFAGASENEEYTRQDSNL